MEIPVSSVNIGPVHKKDVLKAMKSLVSTSAGINKEYACMLVFDVKVMPDAQQFAEENDIKVFTAKIIYHLFDDFTAYVEECKNARKAGSGNKAVFPAICEMVPDACFNRTNPIVIGVNVIEGILKPGTPLCIPDREVSLQPLLFLYVVLFQCLMISLICFRTLNWASFSQLRQTRSNFHLRELPMET